MRNTNKLGSRSVFGDMASFLKHLPNYQEPKVLILLKGHLLIEELLRGYLDRELPNPTKFKHDQFSFAKVLSLCHALTSPKIESWGFEAAEKLNKIRNEIAHELDSPKLQNEIDCLICSVEQHAADSVYPPEDRDEETRLYMAISDLHNEFTNVFRYKPKP